MEKVTLTIKQRGEEESYEVPAGSKLVPIMSSFGFDISGFQNISLNGMIKETKSLSEYKIQEDLDVEFVNKHSGGTI